ncbi:hypothetical protein HYQ45_010568 [Verticillium longisporum]|uniref:Uncharacterized protein n=1 Tax=Verticillium longisporum TaxID=100787 RepID=A0A8I2ZG03_VERLO|nr:hypothetical protein HYQ45_010568 [Verticillium longisporum]
MRRRPALSAVPTRFIITSQLRSSRQLPRVSISHHRRKHRTIRLDDRYSLVIVSCTFVGCLGFVALV